MNVGKNIPAEVGVRSFERAVGFEGVIQPKIAFLSATNGLH